jgi:hypothetical protein
MVRAIAVSIALSICVVAAAMGQSPVNNAARLQVDPFWPKPLPNDWILGQVSGVAVDKRGHVWILQRPRSLSDRRAAESAVE